MTQAGWELDKSIMESVPGHRFVYTYGELQSQHAGLIPWAGMSISNLIRYHADGLFIQLTAGILCLKCQMIYAHWLMMKSSTW